MLRDTVHHSHSFIILIKWLIHSYIHLFNKYLSGTSYVQDSVPGTRDLEMKKQFLFQVAYSLLGTTESKRDKQHEAQEIMLTAA